MVHTPDLEGTYTQFGRALYPVYTGGYTHRGYIPTGYIPAVRVYTRRVYTHRVYTRGHRVFIPDFKFTMVPDAAGDALQRCSRPVPAVTSFRVFMMGVALQGRSLHHWDVKTAFLTTPMDCQIDVTLPEAFNANKDL